MRSMHRAVLAVFAVALAVGAVSASSALATPEWYSSPTKPAPEWQQAGAKLSEAVATKAKGPLALADVGVDVLVECTASGEGTAGPGVADKDTSWTLSSCVAPAKARNAKGEEVANACEKVIKAELKDVPWHTELFLAGSLYDEISAEGAGEPGYSMKCKTVLGEVTDTCDSGALFGEFETSIANATGGVDSTFNGSRAFDCTIGGEGTGELSGTQLIEATKGGKLEANVIPVTFTKITSSHEATGFGGLSIVDTGAKSIGADCDFGIEGGSIKPGGKGTITSFNAPPIACAPTAACGKLESTEAVGLPWETELYESGGVIRERILGSGKGTPGWAFTCAGSERDVCNLTVSPEIVNRGLEDSVFAIFSEALTKTTCKLGGSEKGVWKGELEIYPTSGAIKAEK